MQNKEQLYARNPTLNRRGFLAIGALSAAVVPRAVDADPLPVDPWSKRELIQPIDLAKELALSGDSVRIICVTFPVLYRQKHLPHAQLAGPTSKPEGLAKLHAAVRELPLSTPIVLYCGCCPMNKCPNIRPAFRALKAREFENVRVLSLPTNLHTDWIAKGFPIES